VFWVQLAAKLKFILQQSKKAQRWSTGTALLVLYPRNVGG
jgi:hypothetical protein